ncbi:OmpA family protein [Acinetobacter sp. WZC-1]|uniref:OmpA family protein n=1 Tax=Acinetobacter sp. WZC-1 TaxID=3459034 RepID=UPI00403D818B
MKLIIPALILTALFLGGCTTTKQTTKPSQTISPEHQKVIDELRKGASIYFNKNSSDIDPRYESYLATAASMLNQNTHYVVALQGHTDSSGSATTNSRISYTRANTIRNLLVTQYGVDPAQVTAEGVGSADPVASNDTPDGRAQNRRVTATLKIR